MRRALLLGAVVALFGCGGPVAEEDMAPQVDQSQQELNGQNSLCGGTSSWEKLCALNKTQATCNTSGSHCYWDGRCCKPTYE